MSKQCPYCGAEISEGRKTCGAKTCKKTYHREYQRSHQKKPSYALKPVRIVWDDFKLRVLDARTRQVLEEIDIDKHYNFDYLRAWSDLVFSLDDKNWRIES